MEKDFNKQFIKLIGETDDINIAMFGFGIWKGNKLFFSSYKELYNPLKDKLKNCWDEKVFLDTILAKDPVDKEGILYSKDGISYNLFQLEKAIKFNRPQWAFFFLIGHLIGELLDKEFSLDDLQLYIKNLPVHLKNEYGKKIVFLINYFGKNNGLLLEYRNGNINIL